MPVYEYEPDGHDCLICEGRFETIQAISDPPLKICPSCGMECKRVVSRASFKLGGGSMESRAAKGGFTTFKKAEQGVWEKVTGEGPDVIAGSKEDIAAVQAEKQTPRKIIDLDQ